MTCRTTVRIPATFFAEHHRAALSALARVYAHPKQFGNIGPSPTEARSIGTPKFIGVITEARIEIRETTPVAPTDARRERAISAPGRILISAQRQHHRECENAVTRHQYDDTDGASRAYPTNGTQPNYSGKHQRHWEGELSRRHRHLQTPKLELLKSDENTGSCSSSTSSSVIASQHQLDRGM